MNLNQKEKENNVAHPIGTQFRNHNVQHSRVSSIAKGCGGGMATGGGVNSDAAKDKAQVKRLVKSTALKLHGGAIAARQDRPDRARGGKVGRKRNSKGHTVNVIVAPSETKPPMPMIPGVAAGQPPAALPPRPQMIPPPGLASPGGPPPGLASLPGGPPPLPLRARGGKVNADNAGIGKGRTPVQHSPNKQDGKNIGRGPVITKAAGGPVTSEYAWKKGMAPHAKGGGRGGMAKLDKAHHPEKYIRG